MFGKSCFLFVNYLEFSTLLIHTQTANLTRSFDCIFFSYPKPIVDHAEAKKKYVDEFKRVLAQK